MTIVDTRAASSLGVRRDELEVPHVHEWELRAVEYDSWGQVSFYECVGCPGVRYV